MLTMPNITYPAKGGSSPAYLATPTGQARWPGVVVVHDGFGMTGDIKRITDRFAADGYLSLTPALYHRGNKISCIVRTMKTLTTGKGRRSTTSSPPDWLVGTLNTDYLRFI